MSNEFLSKSFRFDIMREHLAEPDRQQMTKKKSVHAPCLLDTYGYKHTLIMCTTYCCSTATMDARTRVNVTFVCLVFLYGEHQISTQHDVSQYCRALVVVS
jgi:hypothetical protein